MNWQIVLPAGFAPRDGGWRSFALQVTPSRSRRAAPSLEQLNQSPATQRKQAWLILFRSNRFGVAAFLLGEGARTALKADAVNAAAGLAQRDTRISGAAGHQARGAARTEKTPDLRFSEGG